MKKRLLALVMMCAFVATSMLHVSAAPLQNSTGSTASDVAIGADVTQGKTTEYNSGTVESTAIVDVFASKSPYINIYTPKTIVLGTNASGGSDATFKVGAYGDISSFSKFSITCKNSFDLTPSATTVAEMGVPASTKIPVLVKPILSNEFGSCKYTYYNNAIQSISVPFAIGNITDSAYRFINYSAECADAPVGSWLGTCALTFAIALDVDIATYTTTGGYTIVDNGISGPL